MLIRPATTDDIPTLHALAHSIWKKVYPSIISNAQIDFMLGAMYNPEQIASEMGLGFEWEMVEVDGAAVGFVSTRVEDKRKLKVSKIYLEPEFHGRGIGQQILNHVDEKAKRLGVTTVYLFVNRSNVRAVRAYERSGYEVVETLDQSFGDFVLNDFRMAKTF
ncbi:MAG: GNAT family N-acetyltransferase [Planctomycetota bacterium]